MFSTLKLQEMISVEVSSEDAGSEDEPGSRNFSWNITHYEKQQMLIQLQFEDPLVISSSDPDKVKVIFEDTSLIYDFTGQ